MVAVVGVKVAAVVGGVAVVAGHRARSLLQLPPSPEGSECAPSASGGGPYAWHDTGSGDRGKGSRLCGYAYGCSSSGGGCGHGTPGHTRSTSPAPLLLPPHRCHPATQHHSAPPPQPTLHSTTLYTRSYACQYYCTMTHS